LAVGIVDSDFSFNENSGGAASFGKVSNSGGLVGGYAEVDFAYRVCHAASIFTGAQFQDLGHFDQSLAGRSSRLDFGQTIFYELGFDWNF
jgi:hypothetical protein